MRLLRLIRRLGLAALVLLAFSALVRGPEAEKTADQGPPPPSGAVICAAGDADMPPASAEPRSEGLRCARETLAAPQRLCCAPAPVCDRNGIPLTGNTWAESGYLARPPEGMFG